MSGTTLCPHCGTRFKITNEQLELHHGLVRCGHCHYAFDPHPSYIPEGADRQLELPILNALEPSALPLPGTVPPGISQVPEPGQASFGIPGAASSEDYEVEFLSRPSSKLWAFGVALLLPLLVAQAVFMFRVDLAAYMPQLKPWLLSYCKILKCTVPLPQMASLMSIESSELKDDPAHRSQIVLVALLRNRASYAQAFPNLELTLTDLEDSAIARRTFRPEEYLPYPNRQAAGFPAAQELEVRLRLNTTDLKPIGYRLALHYPIK